MFLRLGPGGGAGYLGGAGLDTGLVRPSISPGCFWQSSLERSFIDEGFRKLREDVPEV